MQFRDRFATPRRPKPTDVLAVTIALVLCQHARAQETATPSASSQGLEEILVTAQKRQERAIDVPISISTIDASSIAARGANSLQDLQFSIPGLSITSYGTGGTTF